MREHEVEALKHEQFIARLKAFLADDPYWMYVLTSGNHSQRKRLGLEIGKMVTTIPKPEDMSQVVPREVRRRVDRAFKKQMREVERAATQAASRAVDGVGGTGDSSAPAVVGDGG